MVFHLEDNNTTNEIDQAILKVLLQGQHDMYWLFWVTFIITALPDWSDMKFYADFANVYPQA